MATKAVAKRFGSVKAAKSALKGNRSNGALKRLNADQTLKVRFMTEPDDWYEAHYHWLGGNFVWCNQQTSCPGCKSGDRPRTLVLANAVIFGSDDERDMNRVVVMQMPPTLANSLLKFHEKRGTILDRDYDLTREGSGQNDTVYSADPDDPKTRKMSRFEKDMHDIEAIINSELGDDEEEDDGEPRSSKFQRIREHDKRKKSSRRDEEDDDEYEDEDEDEEEEDERPRRSSRAVAKKKPTRRSSHEDEDDEEDEEEDEDEDERPSKSRKSKYDGLNEFKPKKSGTKTRAVVRRSR